MAFIRAYFNMSDIDEVVVYRGMSSETGWKDVFRTFLNCTFNLEVGREFCDFYRDGKNRISYLVKMTVPVERVFMTYLETQAMNRQYKEAEAVLIYDEIIRI